MQKAKGYQTRPDGHYGTLKFKGKNYVSSRFPLDMDPELLALEVDCWRADKRRDLEKESRDTAPKASLAADIDKFLSKLPEDKRKTGLAQLLVKWSESPLGKRPRMELTRAEIKVQLDAWASGKKRLAGSTLNHRRQALLTLWKGLDPEAKAPQCPAVTIPKWPEAPPRQGFFEADQFAKVLEHLPADHADFVMFAYVTGWRKGEISGLTWAEVDFEGKRIWMAGSRTKSGKPRAMPLGKHLLPLIERRKALKRDSEFVFNWIAPKRLKGAVLPIRNFTKLWEKACRLAGCPDALLHDFRRTAVRNLTRAGVPRPVAMARVGHKTESVFHRYNIVDESDLIESAKFEDALSIPLDSKSAVGT